MGVIFIKPPKGDACIVKKHHGFSCLRSYCKTSKLWVGRKVDSITRTLLKFDAACLPCGLTIISAHIKCYLFQNDYIGTPKTLDVYQVRSKLSRGASLGKKILVGGDPIASANIIEEKDFFVPFNITPLVQSWYSGSAINFGLMIKMRNEMVDNLIGFRSKEYFDSQKWPFLEVTYLDPVDRNSGHAQTIDLVENVLSSDDWNQTAVTYILAFNYSYVVVNVGEYPALVYLQQSAEGEFWETETMVETVAAGQSVILIPNYIAKYARLCYKSEYPQKSTPLNIYIQGRSGV